MLEQVGLACNDPALLCVHCSSTPDPSDVAPDGVSDASDHAFLLLGEGPSNCSSGLDTPTAATALPLLALLTLRRPEP